MQGCSSQWASLGVCPFGAVEGSNLPYPSVAGFVKKELMPNGGGVWVGAPACQRFGTPPPVYNYGLGGGVCSVGPPPPFY